MAITVKFLDDQVHAPVRPKRGEVQVWQASLEGNDSRLAKCRYVLSPDEVIRANRIHQEVHRHRYIMAHGLLRHVLAGALPGCRPEHLVFRVGPHGKPSVDDSMARGLRFNLAHSGDRMLVAVARECEVGIDVEECRSDVDVMALARTALAPHEQALLETAPASGQIDLFFRCWVRKEACLKAWGLGVTTLLSQIDVLASDEITMPGTSLLNCHLFDLAARPGFQAALGVVEG